MKQYILTNNLHSFTHSVFHNTLLINILSKGIVCCNVIQQLNGAFGGSYYLIGILCTYCENVCSLTEERNVCGYLLEANLTCNNQSQVLIVVWERIPAF